LASQKIEKCSGSSELAEKSLHEIQQFIESASDFCLSSPRDFRNMFEDSTTVETKALVSQVRILKEEHTYNIRIKKITELKQNKFVSK
jgi:hypothetical protein